MHTSIVTSILLGALGMGLGATASEKDTQWLPASSQKFEICGMPFQKENEGQWWRLPQRAQEAIPELVWLVSKSPSGVRIRFRSDTTSLSIRYVCDKTQPMLNNFSLHGEAGCDLYVDGKYAITTLPPATSDVPHPLVAGLEKKMRSFCLYLPLYTEVSLEDIGFDLDAEILPPPAFANPLPVVFYGTSITQGGCASRAGLSYTAMLCRQLNLDFVNFGFSGSGRGESAVAELVAKVDASCYVLDFSQNNATVEELDKVYLPFIEILRTHHPDTPIICVTPIYWAYETLHADWKARQNQMKDVVRDAVQKRVDAGDTAIRVVEGSSLLGPECEDGLVDGLHANTLGFYWMAQGLKPHIQDVLHLNK